MQRTSSQEDLTDDSASNHSSIDEFLNELFDTERIMEALQNEDDHKEAVVILHPLRRTEDQEVESRKRHARDISEIEGGTMNCCEVKRCKGDNVPNHKLAVIAKESRRDHGAKEGVTIHRYDAQHHECNKIS